MQSTEGMKPSDGELIAYIKESLTGYEEPYAPGEWEIFNKREKNKRGLIFWTKRLSSAAAVLLIGAGLFLLANRTNTENVVQLTKLTKVTKSKASDPSSALKTGREYSAGSNKEFQDKENIVSMSGLNKIKKFNMPESPHRSLPAKEIARQHNSENMPYALVDLNATAGIQADRLSAVADNRITDRKRTKDEAIPSQDIRITFAEFLADVNQSETPDNKTGLIDQKSNKWGLALILSPSYGYTKELTMGYGVSVGFALSDQITLRSGISYHEMAAIKSFEQPETITVSNAKNLESAEANLTGIDIPIELKYNLNKKIYANLGVSAFAILDHNRSNTYVEARLVERSVPTTAGAPEMRTFVENHRTIEKASDSQILNEKYLGLYNFSFGYKHKISKNTALSIEPFLKVPVKEVTNENLRLIATGLRLRFEL